MELLDMNRLVTDTSSTQPALATLAVSSVITYGSKST
jgi:hypothetical protein